MGPLSEKVGLLLMVSAEVLALVLFLRGRNRHAAWALAFSSVSPVLAPFTQGLFQHVAIDQTDLKIFGAVSVVLALSLLSLWRFTRVCFWLGWSLNLALIWTFVDMAFFWHVFSLG